MSHSCIIAESRCRSPDANFMHHPEKQIQLSIRKGDPERWLGVTAGAGTNVNTGVAGLLAIVITSLFFVLIYLMPASSLRSCLMERGPTQYVAVLFGFWCAVILLIKRRKLNLQRRALGFPVVPEHLDFVLSSQTADEIVRNIHAIAEDPERFIVFNRILIAISNLKNLGRVSDVDEILHSIGERDESAQQTSFATLSGFLWAIPVLGFIGTVLGLAGSIGKFSELLEQQSDVSGIIGSLKDVTAGLSTAFETTLVALLIALAVQLWVTAQKKAEEMFLDDCSEYCLKQIVSRIKILPYEQSREL